MNLSYTEELIEILSQYMDGHRVDDCLSEIEALHAERSVESDIDTVMGGGKPLLERYHDALEVVRKQSLHIQELEGSKTILEDILTSSKTLVNRFEGGRLTYAGVFLKVEEEHREYLEAIGEIVEGQPTSFTLGKPETLRAHAAEELVDCLVTLGGMASFAGLTYADIEAAAHKVLAKNAAKNETTHVWDEKSKTVLRRDKVQS
jgi:hypothetical protein